MHDLDDLKWKRVLVRKRFSISFVFHKDFYFLGAIDL